MMLMGRLHHFAGGALQQRWCSSSSRGIAQRLNLWELQMFSEVDAGQKIFDQGDGPGLRFGVASIQSGRPYLEDTHIAKVGLGKYEEMSMFGVFDGWSTAKVAKRAQDSLVDEITGTDEFFSIDGDGSGLENAELIKAAVRKAFLSLDAKILNDSAIDPQSGSTATMTVVTPSHLIVANAGDSKTVIGQGGHVILATEQHATSLRREYARIIFAGGFVYGDRVLGRLMVPRGFGGRYYKRNGDVDPTEQMVIAEPDFHIIQRHADQIIVSGSDGLWDVLTSTEAIHGMRFLIEKFEQHLVETNQIDSRPLDLAQLCKFLCYFCKDKRFSFDNITALAVKLT